MADSRLNLNIYDFTHAAVPRIGRRAQFATSTPDNLNVTEFPAMRLDPVTTIAKGGDGFLRQWPGMPS